MMAQVWQNQSSAIIALGANSSSSARESTNRAPEILRGEINGLTQISMVQVIHPFGARLVDSRSIKHFVCQPTSDLWNLLDKAYLQDLRVTEMRSTKHRMF